MYSKSEIVQLKQAFWTAFGKYLSLETNSEGSKINWINYHTGIKDLYFRTEADHKKASVSIEITHTDLLLRELFFDKFKSFRNFLFEAIGEEWIWEEETHENGRSISKIYIELLDVNVLNQSDWPAIISFLKPRIVGLDKFWNDVKDGFDELR